MAAGRAIAPPSVQVSKSEGGDYWFTSLSSDVRFLASPRVAPDDIQGVHVLGQPAVAIAILVGSSTNMFSLIHHQNRLVLQNGTHRMYVLRQRGITHVPCLVAEVPDAASLALMGNEAAKQAQLLFKATRPPMFKDYFDQRLHTTIPIARFVHVLRLKLRAYKERIALPSSDPGARHRETVQVPNL
jgi:hypothetical protein